MGKRKRNVQKPTRQDSPTHHASFPFLVRVARVMFLHELCKEYHTYKKNVKIIGHHVIILARVPLAFRSLQGKADYRCVSCCCQRSRTSGMQGSHRRKES